jgi:hypothetical protein
LCAETVVEILEDVEDYKAFEIAIASEYDAQSVVERELVLRLASLLWRIRRATAIETALLCDQAENLLDRSLTPDGRAMHRDMGFSALEAVGLAGSCAGAEGRRYDCEDVTAREGECERAPSASSQASMRDLAYCFKALANLDNSVFDRLRRYEASLWRQIGQTLFALQTARRRFSPALGNRWCDNR